jgi:hypothetical protein
MLVLLAKVRGDHATGSAARTRGFYLHPSKGSGRENGTGLWAQNQLATLNALVKQ